MKVSEALEKVSNIYKPGTAKFYANMKNDPWFCAHEKLNAAMLTKNTEIISIAADAFCSSCKNMIERCNIKQEYVSKADAFYIGNVDKLNKIRSIKEKACLVCGAKENLVVVYEKEKRQGNILCRRCKENVRSHNGLSSG